MLVFVSVHRLGKNGCGSKLKSINLSGCVNITDATMVRLAMALSNANSQQSNNGSSHKPGCTDGNNVSCLEGMSITEGNTCDVEIVEPLSPDTECLCERYYEICKASIREACARSCGVAAPDPCSLRVHESAGSIQTRCESCSNQRMERVGCREDCRGHDPSSGPFIFQSSGDLSKKHCDTGGGQVYGCSNCHKSQHSKGDPYNNDGPQHIYTRTTDLKPTEKEGSLLDSDHISCHTYCATAANEGRRLHSLEDCFPDPVSHTADHFQPTELHYEQPCDMCSKGGKCCKKKPSDDDRIRYLESINLSGCYQITDLGLR